MTMTAAEILLTIGEDGTLKLPREVLDALGTRQVWLTVQEGLITIKPRARTIHEIEDAGERAMAYQTFKRQVMRPGGGPVPVTRAELNELVYD